MSQSEECIELGLSVIERAIVAADVLGQSRIKDFREASHKIIDLANIDAESLLRPLQDRAGCTEVDLGIVNERVKKIFFEHRAQSAAQVLTGEAEPESIPETCDLIDGLEETFEAIANIASEFLPPELTLKVREESTGTARYDLFSGLSDKAKQTWSWASTGEIVALDILKTIPLQSGPILASIRRRNKCIKLKEIKIEEHEKAGKKFIIEL